MHLRKALLQAAQHLAIPVERQLRMQPADDVEFGDRFASSPRRRRCQTSSSDMVYAFGSLARLPNAHSRQLATQTSVGLMWRLTLK